MGLKIDIRDLVGVLPFIPLDGLLGKLLSDLDCIIGNKNNCIELNVEDPKAIFNGDEEPFKPLKAFLTLRLRKLFEQKLYSTEGDSIYEKIQATRGRLIQFKDKSRINNNEDMIRIFRSKFSTLEQKEFIEIIKIFYISIKMYIKEGKPKENIKNFLDKVVLITRYIIKSLGQKLTEEKYIH